MTVPMTMTSGARPQAMSSEPLSTRLAPETAPFEEEPVVMPEAPGAGAHVDLRDPDAAVRESAAAASAVNDVRLQGRLSAVPELRELPSGARMVVFRLVVDRACGRGKPATGRSPGIDTIDCVRWDEPADSPMLAWVPGSTILVEGCLRRRFWRAGGGALVSRYEVDVHRATFPRESLPPA